MFAIRAQTGDMEVDGGATIWGVFLEKDVALYSSLCENGDGVCHIGGLVFWVYMVFCGVCYVGCHTGLFCMTFEGVRGLTTTRCLSASLFSFLVGSFA